MLLKVAVVAKGSGNKKAGPYKNPIGPKADWTQYNEKLGPSSAYYAVDLKKRDEAEKAHLLLKTKSDKQQTVKQKADELQLKTGNKLFSQVAKGKVSVSDLAGAFGKSVQLLLLLEQYLLVQLLD